MKKGFSISKKLETIIYNNFPDKNDFEYVIQELKKLYDYYAQYEDYIGERIFAGVLKLGGNTIEKFNKSIELAKSDWRDTLMNAGFGNNINIHRKWINKKSGVNNP